MGALGRGQEGSGVPVPSVHGWHSLGPSAHRQPCVATTPPLIFPK